MHKLIDWLIDCSFTSRSRIFHLRRHHCQWRAVKSSPMLGAQGLWAGRDLYHATPAVTQDLGFCYLIRRTVPFSRLLWHAWGCGRSVLTRILTGMHNLPFGKIQYRNLRCLELLFFLIVIQYCRLYKLSANAMYSLPYKFEQVIVCLFVCL
jgi:hypothetical protein